MSLFRMLGLAMDSRADPAVDTGSDTLERIAGALERFGPERARYLASFAFTLSRVAHADLHISEDESKVMRELLLNYGLDDSEASLVVEMAKEHTVLFGSTQGFSVTRELNRMAGREEKLALLDCLFAVCAADRTITGEEEKEIRKIADELHLTRREYTAIRLKYRDQLSIFKKPGEKDS